MTVQEEDVQLEIGHVLLIDIVRHSKKLADEQTVVVTRLNDLVRGTPQFRAVKRPAN